MAKVALQEKELAYFPLEITPLVDLSLIKPNLNQFWEALKEKVRS